MLQAELGPQLTDYMINEWAPAVGKALLYGVLHSLVHSVVLSLRVPSTRTRVRLLLAAHDS